MPCCSAAPVAVHAVSPRLFVSGCTIRSPPVTLIGHSSAEPAGHQIFISCFLTGAERRNGWRSVWRDAVLISPGLPLPLRPSCHTFSACSLHNMLLRDDGFILKTSALGFAQYTPPKTCPLISVNSSHSYPDRDPISPPQSRVGGMFQTLKQPLIMGH